MALIFIIIIFLLICVYACYDYMFSLVRLLYILCMELYSIHIDDHYVGDKQCVNVVFIQRLSAIAPYIPGRVVDRGSDSPVESFGIHPPNVGLVEFIITVMIKFRPWLLLVMLAMCRSNPTLP